MGNARDFLAAGVNQLFTREASSRDAKLAVVAIQTAVELLAKYRITREVGFSAIVRKGAVSGGDILRSAEQRQFSTLGFDDCLDAVATLEFLGEWERHLIANLQKQRNTLVHFARTIDPEQARQSIAGLLVYVLALFAAGQDKDAPQAETHERFLDKDGLKALLCHPEFRAEAFDAASGDQDADAIFRCWNCECETLTRRPSGTYFCWCCGLTADVGIAAFVDCWQCSREAGVCYDRLNATDGTHHGRCLACGGKASVRFCDQCGSAESAASPGELKVCRCSSSEQQ